MLVCSTVLYPRAFNVVKALFDDILSSLRALHSKLKICEHRANVNIINLECIYAYFNLFF